MAKVPHYTIPFLQSVEINQPYRVKGSESELFCFSKPEDMILKAEELSHKGEEKVAMCVAGKGGVVRFESAEKALEWIVSLLDQLHSLKP
jgi:hypothetical protein